MKKSWELKQLVFLRVYLSSLFKSFCSAQTAINLYLILGLQQEIRSVHQPEISHFDARQAEVRALQLHDDLPRHRHHVGQHPPAAVRARRGRQPRRTVHCVH